MPIKVTKEVKWGLKVFVTLLISGYLLFVYYSNQHQYHELITEVFLPQNGITLFTLFLLMFLNWGFEAQKWKLLAGKVEKINFSQALKAVLIGVSFGIVAPKSVGECVGRFLMLKSFKKFRLIGSLLLGQAFQLSATLLFGVPAAWYYVKKVDGDLKVSLSIGVLFLIVSAVGLVFRKPILSMLFNTSLGLRLKAYLMVVKEYTKVELFQVLFYSIARYLTFTFQFIIMLKLLQVDFSILELFMVISVVYLIKSLLFSVNFIADMGMRQITAVSVMSVVGISESSAVLASFGLWSINILFPAIIGLYFWVQLKLKW